MLLDIYIDVLSGTLFDFKIIRRYTSTKLEVHFGQTPVTWYNNGTQISDLNTKNGVLGMASFVK